MKRFEWPNGARCAVIFTLDVDGEANYINKDPKNADRIKLMSHAKFGPELGVFLLLDLFQKYGLKASWFVPGFVAEQHPDSIKEIAKKGHEVAHHGYMHESCDKFTSLEKEKEVLLQTTRILQELVGERPHGYRAPGEYSPNTFRLLHEHGFTYEAGMKGGYWPVFWKHDGKDTDLVLIPTSFIVDDWPNFAISSEYRFGPMVATSQFYEICASEFDACYNYGYCFAFTGHPQLIGRPSRVLMLEKLIQHIRELPDVWIGTGLELAKHWRATYSRG